MCVIIVKPENKDLNKEYVENCFENNGDGSGFAVSRGKYVKIRKGFFKFEEFWEAICKEIKKEDFAILHCRIATHGLVDGGNTHPFPLSRRTDILRKTEINTILPAMAHNGIFSGMGTFESELSDSQIFVQDILSEEIVRDNLFENKAIQKLVSEFIGTNKIAVIYKDRKIKMFGHFEEEDGIYYSNYTFRIENRSNSTSRYTRGGIYSYNEDNYDVPPVHYHHTSSKKEEKEELKKLVDKEIRKEAKKFLLPESTVSNTFLKGRCLMCKEWKAVSPLGDVDLCENCKNMVISNMGGIS